MRNILSASVGSRRFTCTVNRGAFRSGLCYGRLLLSGMNGLVGRDGNYVLLTEPKRVQHGGGLG